ncbi:MAG: hypothetical protein J3K34DRAFT_519765 [Monoraphidium minutum]|nr:MAG: hypothetical protein J3K34DRAFT_519765 [Monoraphidium minutum]
MLAVVAGSHPGPPPARPRARSWRPERGARAPCNSWSVRSASCQGLVPPSITSGARCDGIDRGCKGQQQRSAEALRKATKEANAGVTGERYMWRQCFMLRSVLPGSLADQTWRPQLHSALTRKPNREAALLTWVTDSVFWGRVKLY